MERDKWNVTHTGSGRGVFTTVTFEDGRSVKLSGRLNDYVARDIVAKLVCDWETLGMLDDALGPVISSEERFARVVANG